MIPPSPHAASVDKAVNMAEAKIEKELLYGFKSGNTPLEVAGFIARCLNSLSGVDIKKRLLVQRLYSRLSPEDLEVLQDSSGVPLFKRKEVFQKLQMAMASDPEFFTLFLSEAMDKPMEAMKLMGSVLAAKDDRPSDNVSSNVMQNIVFLVDQDTPEKWQERMNKAKDITPEVKLPPITVEGFQHG